MKKIYSLLAFGMLILCLQTFAQITPSSQWTWMKGDNTPTHVGIYGTKGVPDINNKPGTRHNAVSWTDNNGNFWLFGGQGVAEVISVGLLNDLWKYEPSTNTWTWVHGSKVQNQASISGTQGVPDANNTPGARHGSVTWVDNNGDFWLFGGSGNTTSPSTVNSFNDLWKYDVDLNTWTWVKGDVTADEIGVYGTKGIPDVNNKPGARNEATAWKDAANNLWLFGGNGQSSSGAGVLNDLWKFDILTNSWTWINGDNLPAQPGVYGSTGIPDVANKPGTRYAAAGWTDAIGDFWLYGGFGNGLSATQANLNDLWRYNVAGNVWTFMKGSPANSLNQTGIYGTQGVPAITNRPGSRRHASTWTDNFGNLWIFGGFGFSSTPGGSGALLNDLWSYNIASNSWTWVKGDNVNGQIGIYGSMGVPDAANKPSARYNSVSWVDNTGNFWLFGGDGLSSTSTTGRLNDLWRLQGSGLGGNTYYRDNDNDTYGDPANSTIAATPPVGYVSNNTDCNDGNINVNPGAAEICDGVDNNCNGVIDEGVKTTFYRDQDGDTYGDPASTIQACSAPAGYVTNSTDCNDNNVNVYPGATEICDGVDNDCDTQIDENGLTTFYRDQDGDSYGNASNSIQSCSAPAGYVTNSTDCNDNNANVYPGATETCDGVDNDCDGQIDENGLTTFYRDQDGDSYGNASNSIQSCSAPAGYVTNNTDCNDNNSNIRPGATEICNGVDDDCDGQIDEGVKTTFYRDQDGDGYGNAGMSTQACSAPAGYVTNSTDCNDNNANVYPGATETCDGVDNDCDGQIDENGLTTFYRDQDGDSYGNASNSVQSCSAPAGYVTNNTDCNDNNSNIRPGATEICNGVDDDCDGQIDEGVKTTFYRDQDGDGYGNAGMSTQACSAPAGYVTNSTDCNDNNANVYPGATETCDGVDNDCDGQIDENGLTTFYRDQDGDSYGNASNSIQSCSAPAGYVTNNTDCNDNNSNIRPGATEICDGVDNDCDGQIDENGLTTFYRDQDGDSYGNASNSVQSCSAPAGYVTNNTDCNDNNSNIRPGATEICNGVDDDCDGLIDEGVKTTFYRDQDGDGYGNAGISTQACSKPQGYVTNNTDCNDNNSNVRPGIAEICDGLDNDCDGLIDEGVKTTFYRDQDGDGYGNAGISTQACSVPQGYVTNNTDCNDNNSNVRPGAGEVCGNNIDDNCNGQVDEACNSNLQLCMFNQDFYGDQNTSCSSSGPINSKQLMLNAVDAQPGDSVIFGLKSQNRFFTLKLSDIQNNSIFTMLPGTGSSDPLKGYATYSRKNTWNNVPVNGSGKLNNALLSESITGFFNMHLSPQIATISIDRVLRVRQMQFCILHTREKTIDLKIKESVIKCLVSKHGSNGVTIGNLYKLGNDLLGNVNTCKVKITDVEDAIKAVNEAFDGCVIFLGYKEKSDKKGDDDDRDDDDRDDDDDDDDKKDKDKNKDRDDDDKAKALPESNLLKEGKGSTNVYPNPTKGNFELMISNKQLGKIQVEIVNANGVLVETRNILIINKVQKLNFDLSRHAAGVYLLKLRSGGTVETHKVVLQK